MRAVHAGLHKLVHAALSFAPHALAMPLLVSELAVQPARSYGPRAVDGLAAGVRFACLAPDRTPRAAEAVQRLSTSAWRSPRSDQNVMHEVGCPA